MKPTLYNTQIGKFEDWANKYHLAFPPEFFKRRELSKDDKSSRGAQRDYFTRLQFLATQVFELNPPIQIQALNDLMKIVDELLQASDSLNHEQAVNEFLNILATKSQEQRRKFIETLIQTNIIGNWLRYFSNIKNNKNKPFEAFVYSLTNAFKVSDLKRRIAETTQQFLERNATEASLQRLYKEVENLVKVDKAGTIEEFNIYNHSNLDLFKIAYQILKIHPDELKIFIKNYIEHSYPQTETHTPSLDVPPITGGAQGGSPVTDFSDLINSSDDEDIIDDDIINASDDRGRKASDDASSGDDIQEIPLDDDHQIQITLSDDKADKSTLLTSGSWEEVSLLDAKEREQIIELTKENDIKPLLAKLDSLSENNPKIKELMDMLATLGILKNLRFEPKKPEQVIAETKPEQKTRSLRDLFSFRKTSSSSTSSQNKKGVSALLSPTEQPSVPTSSQSPSDHIIVSGGSIPTSSSSTSSQSPTDQTIVADGSIPTGSPTSPTITAKIISPQKKPKSESEQEETLERVKKELRERRLKKVELSSLQDYFQALNKLHILGLQQGKDNLSFPFQKELDEYLKDKNIKLPLKPPEVDGRYTFPDQKTELSFTKVHVGSYIPYTVAYATIFIKYILKNESNSIERAKIIKEILDNPIIAQLTQKDMKEPYQMEPALRTLYVQLGDIINNDDSDLAHVFMGAGFSVYKAVDLIDRKGSSALQKDKINQNAKLILMTLANKLVDDLKLFQKRYEATLKVISEIDHPGYALGQTDYIALNQARINKLVEYYSVLKNDMRLLLSTQNFSHFNDAILNVLPADFEKDFFPKNKVEMADRTNVDTSLFFEKNDATIADKISAGFQEIYKLIDLLPIYNSQSSAISDEIIGKFNALTDYANQNKRLLYTYFEHFPELKEKLIGSATPELFGHFNIVGFSNDDCIRFIVRNINRMLVDPQFNSVASELSKIKNEFIIGQSDIINSATITGEATRIYEPYGIKISDPYDNTQRYNPNATKIHKTRNGDLIFNGAFDILYARSKNFKAVTAKKQFLELMVYINKASYAVPSEDLITYIIQNDLNSIQKDLINLYEQFVATSIIKLIRQADFDDKKGLEENFKSLLGKLNDRGVRLRTMALAFPDEAPTLIANEAVRVKDAAKNNQINKVENRKAVLALDESSVLHDKQLRQNNPNFMDKQTNPNVVQINRLEADTIHKNLEDFLESFSSGEVKEVMYEFKAEIDKIYAPQPDNGETSAKPTVRRNIFDVFAEYQSKLIAAVNRIDDFYLPVSNNEDDTTNIRAYILAEIAWRLPKNHNIYLARERALGRQIIGDINGDGEERLTPEEFAKLIAEQAQLKEKLEKFKAGFETNSSSSDNVVPDEQDTIIGIIEAELSDLDEMIESRNEESVKKVLETVRIFIHTEIKEKFQTSGREPIQDLFNVISLTITYLADMRDSNVDDKDLVEEIEQTITLLILSCNELSDTLKLQQDNISGSLFNPAGSVPESGSEVSSSSSGSTDSNSKSEPDLELEPTDSESAKRNISSQFNIEMVQLKSLLITAVRMAKEAYSPVEDKELYKVFEDLQDTLNGVEPNADTADEVYALFETHLDNAYNYIATLPSSIDQEGARNYFNGFKKAEGVEKVEGFYEILEKFKPSLKNESATQNDTTEKTEDHTKQVMTSEQKDREEAIPVDSVEADRRRVESEAAERRRVEDSEREQRRHQKGAMSEEEVQAEKAEKDRVKQQLEGPAYKLQDQRGTSYDSDEEDPDLLEALIRSVYDQGGDHQGEVPVTTSSHQAIDPPQSTSSSSHQSTGANAPQTPTSTTSSSHQSTDANVPPPPSTSSSSHLSTGAEGPPSQSGTSQSETSTLDTNKKASKKSSFYERLLPLAVRNVNNADPSVLRRAEDSRDKINKAAEERKSTRTDKSNSGESSYAGNNSTLFSPTSSTSNTPKQQPTQSETAVKTPSGNKGGPSTS